MNESALLGIRGPVVIACPGPCGVGGLGRHVFEIADLLQKRGLPTRVIEKGPAPLGRFAARFSAAWAAYYDAAWFDATLAKALPKARTFIGFAGYSLSAMASARRRGYESIYLVSPMAHINLTAAQGRKSWEYAPIEALGQIPRQHEAMRREYEAADRILYASEYVRESFLRENVPAAKLERFDLSADPRFKRAQPKRDAKFTIVSVGALNSLKGTPVLLDAFARFEHPGAELILVGNSGSRAMRRYLQQCLARDPRVRIAPGDPLPHLLNASVLVHASFQDGFGYAPMEAMACGVPVIVTDHTGMKEFVREGENGFVIPAGDPDAIVVALKKVAR